MLRLNRVVLLFVFIFIISGLLSTFAFAAKKSTTSDFPDFYYEEDTKATPLKQCFLDIKKPNIKRKGTLTTFGKSYSISAYTEDENVKVTVLVWDGEEEKYLPYKDPKDSMDTDTVGIGASGLFVKVMQLELGVNKIKIVAEKKVKESKDKTQVTYLKIKRISNDDMMNSIKEDMVELFDTE